MPSVVTSAGSKLTAGTTFSQPVAAPAIGNRLLFIVQSERNSATAILTVTDNLGNSYENLLNTTTIMGSVEVWISGVLTNQPTSISGTRANALIVQAALEVSGVHPVNELGFSNQLSWPSSGTLHNNFVKSNKNPVLCFAVFYLASSGQTISVSGWTTQYSNNATGTFGTLSREMTGTEFSNMLEASWASTSQSMSTAFTLLHDDSSRSFGFSA